MDALGITTGSAVADVGCGDGYFVEHLSHRVGASGAVYGVDVDEDALRDLRKRVEREKLANVKVIHGKTTDPDLPADSLDAVLIVNAYHERRGYDAMLRAVRTALKPGGRLAIIDAVAEDNSSRSAQTQAHTIAESLVRKEAEAAGLRFRSKEKGFERTESNRKHWYFLVFER
jgi:predicted methyltransferase